MYEEHCGEYCTCNICNPQSNDDDLCVHGLYIFEHCNLCKKCYYNNDLLYRYYIRNNIIFITLTNPMPKISTDW